MISDLPYALDFAQKIPWTSTQEKSLAIDFPFELEHNDEEQYVARTYLQFLWLPESIMPLNLFVPSMLRITPLEPSSSTPTKPHPLHILLKPLLLTARTASSKYKVELSQILDNGGGAGEMEETMMWYVINNEKADDDLWAKTSATGDGPWVDEKWREKWIQRLERREFMIQILLYFLLLSLPGPRLPMDSQDKKSRKRKKGTWDATEKKPPELEDYLEAFMDKLSMWQLIDGLDRTSSGVTSSKRTDPDYRDWMQLFLEEVLEPQFKTQLPDQCALLRSKIFPASLRDHSAAASPSSSRHASPVASAQDSSKRRETSVVSNRHASPAIPVASADASRSFSRTRSRSLSISLAEERERERAKTVGLAAAKKRILNREVSMSRVFRPKAPKPAAAADLKGKGRASVVGEKKPGANNQAKRKAKDEGVLLVEDTPMKPRIKAISKTNSPLNADSRSNNSRAASQNGLFGSRQFSQVLETLDEDEEWCLESSPAKLLLASPSVPKRSRSNNALGIDLPSDTDDEDGHTFALDTPSKRRRLSESPCEYMTISICSP